jgi:hypothetical protein
MLSDFNKEVEAAASMSCKRSMRPSIRSQGVSPVEKCTSDPPMFRAKRKTSCQSIEFPSLN